LDQPLIFATDLHKTFGKVHAVDGVNLAIQPGEIYGLVGPDGAGKTTTLRLLCGALRPTQGEVTIAGFPLAHRMEQARAHIGYLSQRFSLYEELTVWENLRFFAEVRGLPHERWAARSQEILNFVGLAEFGERRVGQLSGGMKQKLGLALALVNEPKVLLLDEPTTGVDPVTRQDFWRLIIRIVASESIAVMICTPYMDEASRCTRVGFMRSGKMIVEGTPRSLRERLAGCIMELVGEPLPVLLQVVRSTDGVESVQRFGDTLHLRIASGKAKAVSKKIISAIKVAKGKVNHLELIDPLLEDVFISLTEAME
jgi:ABC-2 type transport system ATP-binding protein